MRDPEAPRAEIPPAQGRRWFAILTNGLLAAIVIWIALAHPPSALGWRFFLLFAGAAAGWAAFSLHRGTRAGLVYADHVLSDGMGREIARLDEIRSVQRGALAFKPSNGFLLTLDRAKGARWVPGLWWRVGRFVGVGGVTPSGATRFVAELIAAEIARRDGARTGPPDRG